MSYTPPSRESIYAALFELVRGTEGLKTVSRKLTSLAQVASEEKPALYQLQVEEDVKHDLGSGMPYLNKARVEIYVFVSQEDSALPNSPPLNALVDAVVAILWPTEASPPSDERQTLGGLVEDVRIDGKIEYREGGPIGPHAMAVIPIEMLIAGLQPD
ncbi:MAG: hypothetical protein ACRDQZ_25575 [Mycobacteriales bacterium]